MDSKGTAAGVFLLAVLGKSMILNAETKALLRDLIIELRGLRVVLNDVLGELQAPPPKLRKLSTRILGGRRAKVVHP